LYHLHIPVDVYFIHIKIINIASFYIKKHNAYLQRIAENWRNAKKQIKKHTRLKPTKAKNIQDPRGPVKQQQYTPDPQQLIIKHPANLAVR